MLTQGFGSFPSVYLREFSARGVFLDDFKPMVVDLEVDVILGDEFYYYCFFYSKMKLGFTKSIFLKKAMNGCRT